MSGKLSSNYATFCWCVIYYTFSMLFVYLNFICFPKITLCASTHTRQPVIFCQIMKYLKSISIFSFSPRNNIIFQQRVACCTLAILWLLCKILRRSSQGNPSAGGIKCKRDSKIEQCWTYRRLYLINGTRQMYSFYCRRRESHMRSIKWWHCR